MTRRWREGEAVRDALKRLIMLAVLAVALPAAGCAQYWNDRASDFADTFDIGVTFSRKPQFVFYHSFESIVALGYANYEAMFYGWGGGQFGAERHCLKAYGVLLWGDEEAGWGNYNRNDPNTLYTQYVGLVGMPVGLATGNSNPHYVPT